MNHDPLLSIIKRYTPTMLDVVAAASAEDIARLEAAAGPLPEGYRQFLEWMGDQCPFLEGEQLAYSPSDLMDLIYEDLEYDMPEGVLWIGVDKSGSGFSVYLRQADGVIARAGYHEGISAKDLLPESSSIASYLATCYVRTTLIHSHPLHFSAAFKGDAQQTQELWRRVDEACSHFEITHPLAYPDFRFYGSTDFVIGVHQRPGDSIVNLHFGAIERARYEPWYDLVFARWRSMSVPES
jgi:hypothetical protein